MYLPEFFGWENTFGQVWTSVLHPERNKTSPTHQVFNSALNAKCQTENRNYETIQILKRSLCFFVEPKMATSNLTVKDFSDLDISAWIQDAITCDFGFAQLDAGPGLSLLKPSIKHSSTDFNDTIELPNFPLRSTTFSLRWDTSSACSCRMIFGILRFSSTGSDDSTVSGAQRCRGRSGDGQWKDVSLRRSHPPDSPSAYWPMETSWNWSAHSPVRHGNSLYRPRKF